jgi:hypothetical protein
LFGKGIVRGHKRRVDTQPKAIAFASALEKCPQYAAIVNTADAVGHSDTVGSIWNAKSPPHDTDSSSNSFRSRYLQGREIKATLRNIVSWSVRLVHGGLGGGTETHYCQAAKEIRDGALTTSGQLLNRLKSVIQ